MFFDSHVHLDDIQFDADRAAVIERALAAKVTHLVNVGADMASSARSMELARQYEHIYAAVGVHPHEAAALTDRDYDDLAEYLTADKVVALGEIGLDYYYDYAPRDTQRAVFIRQLDIARQLHCPVIIHNRDAHGDTMSILKREAKGLVGVVHCFSGSMEMAEELIAMGWSIGVDGPVTFKNAAKLPEIVARLPAESLLIETDCPYLTPIPYRGRRNEPAFVSLVAERIAEIRRMEVAELAAITEQNAARVFGIVL